MAVSEPLRALPAFDVNADEDAILEAIAIIRPQGALQLATINPNKSGAPQVRSFVMPDEREPASRWAVDQNDRGANVYFMPNIAAADLHRKADRAHMAVAAFVWADCDPAIARYGSYERAREHLLERHFGELRQTASFVIDSGNGLQAFWRLQPGVSLPDGAGEYEDVNKEIGAAFDGPATFDCCRLMRLPGTVNYPTAAKLGKGYPTTPGFARLLAVTGKIYTLDQLRTLAKSRRLQLRFDEFLAGSPKAKVQWEGSNADLQDGSGSGMDQSMVLFLWAAEFSEDEVRQLLEPWPHGGAGRSQGDRYWKRMWDKASAGGETAPKARSVPKKLAFDPKAHSMFELMHKTFAPMHWPVAEYVPEGTILVAGKPKSGKSWFVLNLMLSAVLDERFLKRAGRAIGRPLPSARGQRAADAGSDAAADAGVWRQDH